MAMDSLVNMASSYDRFSVVVKPLTMEVGVMCLNPGVKQEKSCLQL
jgi:hypothetical protein